MSGAAEIGTDAGNGTAPWAGDAHHAYCRYLDAYSAAHPQARSEADAPGQLSTRSPAAAL